MIIKKKTTELNERNSFYISTFFVDLFVCLFWPNKAILSFFCLSKKNQKLTNLKKKTQKSLKECLRN